LPENKTKILLVDEVGVIDTDNPVAVSLVLVVDAPVDTEPCTTCNTAPAGCWTAVRILDCARLFAPIVLIAI
jgi:hypothetical protein